jgi:glycosyltransferase involved in cell wall biosynthesis
MALRVLMATMGLGIGGAETHIVELAGEMKRRGMDVIVASNGGVYVREIEEKGVRHFAVPMNRRNIFSIIRSYFMLRRIIRAEKPDIVHAHARIPAFICGILKKSLRFPFVTTAHLPFDISGGLRYLSNWGEKTIAVSEDIKEYLIKNFKIPESDIYVTINGIDTDKFSAMTSGAGIIQEFQLDASKPVITSVSRLDASRALSPTRSSARVGAGPNGSPVSSFSYRRSAVMYSAS